MASEIIFGGPKTQGIDRPQDYMFKVAQGKMALEDVPAMYRGQVLYGLNISRDANGRPRPEQFFPFTAGAQERDENEDRPGYTLIHDLG